jgi:hypothetical protein
VRCLVYPSQEAERKEDKWISVDDVVYRNLLSVLVMSMPAAALTAVTMASAKERPTVS